MFDQALAFCRQAFDLVPRSADSQQVYLKAYIEYELGKFYRDQGDWPAAHHHLHVARGVFCHDESDPVFNMELAWGILSNLGFVENQLGDFDSAEQLYLQCLSFFKELGSRGNMATLLARLALLKEQRGHSSEALQYATEALDWSRRLGMLQEQMLMETLCTQLAKEGQSRR